jgi:release factor glutamine methyltransferase
VKKGIAKRLVSKILVPATKKYLEKDREVKFMNMHLHVPSGVFHPSLFFSTKTMCQFLSTLNLKNKQVIEIGCGSGALSIYAAKLGAQVFCCDINPLAVTTTQQNAQKNQVSITVIESDLFELVPDKKFDLILNNPPYYPKDPTSQEEKAWYAGKNLEYFKRFFQQSLNCINPGGIIYMVLSDDCDLGRIDQFTNKNGFTGKMVYSHRNLLEKTFVMAYSIRQ